MSRRSEGDVMLQIPLSDGTQATLRATQQLTTTTIAELLAYLMVYEWVLRRNEMKEVHRSLASSVSAWWHNREPPK